MMRRSRKRPYAAEHVPLNADKLQSIPRSEDGPGGVSYTVRQIRGSEKAYTCPGCHRAIPPGSAHIVAWSNEHLFGAEAAIAERRHWHTGCWRAARRQR